MPILCFSWFWRERNLYKYYVCVFFMLESEILKEIAEKHREKLRYIDINHRKLLICFSGVPGSGKSNIAKLIEEKYSGVRVSTDELRRIIKKMGEKDSRLWDEVYKEEVLEKYLYGLLEDWPFENGLVVLDKGIERDYKKVFSHSGKSGFKIFLIRVYASREILTGRMKERHDGTLTDNFVNNVDRWIEEFKEFGENFESDLVINNDADDNPDIRDVFSVLDGVVKRLSDKHKI